MGYASKAGRAKVDARNPRAFGICDRCGFLYNHCELRWQFDYAGAGLINRRILVCDTCEDVPQAQLRNIILPADPTPIINARIQDYIAAESDERTTSGQNTTDFWTGIPIPGDDVRITQNDDIRVTQMTGEPPGGYNELPGTDPNAVTYRKISGVNNNGIGQIRLTMSTTNGMINGQKVTIREVNGVPNANGNFVISIVDATHVDLNNSTFAGYYVGGGYVINDPGVPLGFNEVPRTGPLPPYITGNGVQWINAPGNRVIWINQSGQPVAWVP